MTLDPTNEQSVNMRHIVVARGRDYNDVPPLLASITEVCAEHRAELIELGDDARPRSSSRWCRPAIRDT